MKSATISEIKSELMGPPSKKVLELCVQLAKFRKENKEFLNYLLFEAANEQGYVEGIKKEIDEAFWNLSPANIYMVKKGLRKILRSISRYGKYPANKETEIQLLLHFCTNLDNSAINFQRNKVLSNMFQQQLKKLSMLIQLVHEDLQFDYKKQLDQLSD